MTKRKQPAEPSRILAKAIDWLGDAEINKRLPVERASSTPADLRSFAYWQTELLLRKAVRRDAVTSAEEKRVLRLLRAALKITNPSPLVAWLMGLPPVSEPQHRSGLDKLASKTPGQRPMFMKYLTAAGLNAQKPNINISELARVAGVERATIRAWRKAPEFKYWGDICAGWDESVKSASQK